MPPLSRLLFVVVLPACCALAGLALAGQPWRRARPLDPRTGMRGWAWGGALGFALGFILATWRIVGRWPVIGERAGWLPYGPTTGEDWLSYLVAIAGAMGMAAAFNRAPLWARVAIRALVSILVVALVLNWRIGRQWDGLQEIALGLGILGGALFVLWNGLSALAERSEGAPLPVALWTACAGAAGTILLARNATFAEQLGALASCCGSAFVLSLWRSDLTLARGVTPVFAVAYGGILVAARYNLDDLGTPAAVLLAAAPLAAWVTQFRPLRRKGAVVRTLAAMAATAFFVGAAAALVYFSRPEVGEYGY